MEWFRVDAEVTSSMGRKARRFMDDFESMGAAEDFAMKHPFKGWTVAREVEHGGLWVLRDPSGAKRGSTQTESGIRIMRRRKVFGRPE